MSEFEWTNSNHHHEFIAGCREVCYSAQTFIDADKFLDLIDRHNNWTSYIQLVTHGLWDVTPQYFSVVVEPDHDCDEAQVWADMMILAGCGLVNDKGEETRQIQVASPLFLTRGRGSRL